jgi:hypothetical protein
MPTGYLAPQCGEDASPGGVFLGIDARLLDLKDYPMFFDQPVPPAMPGRRPYEHEAVKKWTAEIASASTTVSLNGSL